MLEMLLNGILTKLPDGWIKTVSVDSIVGNWYNESIFLDWVSIDVVELFWEIDVTIWWLINWTGEVENEIGLISFSLEQEKRNGIEINIKKYLGI